MVLIFLHGPFFIPHNQIKSLIVVSKVFLVALVSDTSFTKPVLKYAIGLQQSNFCWLFINAVLAMDHLWAYLKSFLSLLRTFCTSSFSSAALELFFHPVLAPLRVLLSTAGFFWQLGFFWVSDALV